MPGALLRPEQAEVVAMPAGGVCWMGSCSQVRELELREEMSRLHGIREVGWLWSKWRLL